MLHNRYSSQAPSTYLFSSGVPESPAVSSVAGLQMASAAPKHVPPFAAIGTSCSGASTSGATAAFTCKLHLQQISMSVTQCQVKD